MSQTLTTYASALRNVYQDDIREQLNQRCLVSKVRKKQRDEMTLTGNGFVVVLHSSRNYSGVMSTGDDGLVGAAGNQGVASITVPFRDIKGRFGITFETIKASESNKGAVTAALEYERTQLTNDIERQLNRQFWGFGQGNLATISAGATSTSQSLKDPGGIVGTVNPARFIQPGMVVAFQTAGVINNVKTVSAVNQTTGVITVPSITTTTGDLLIMGATDGTNNNSEYNKGIMGLTGLIDGTTYSNTIFGLDKTTAGGAFFKSGVKTAVGPLSEDLLYRLIHNQATISGVKVTDFFTGVETVREYIKLTQADRRYTGADLRKPDAGVDNAGWNESNNTGLSFAGIPITEDKDAPYGSLYGICMPHLFVGYLTDGEWDLGGNGQDLRFVTNKTSYEAIYVMMLNMYTDRANSHFRADGISVTVDAAVVAD